MSELHLPDDVHGHGGAFVDHPLDHAGDQGTAGGGIKQAVFGNRPSRLALGQVDGKGDGVVGHRGIGLE